jgi:hypothetical protein
MSSETPSLSRTYVFPIGHISFASHHVGHKAPGEEGCNAERAIVVFIHLLQRHSGSFALSLHKQVAKASSL